MVASTLEKITSISCFTFNKDFSQVALCPNNNTFRIYILPSFSAPFSKWALDHTLVKHDSIVSSLDWSHETNYIVSCGHDRNAYVWIYSDEKNTWEPTLVILRINRAANAVSWSPNGKKFAVASSAKVVPICRYEKSNDWWVSKMLKKHKSTVLSVGWHPNNVFLLTGGCDYKCRIFSAFIEGLDEFEDEEEFAFFDKQKSFGALLAVIDCGKGWIEGVAWSPNRLEGAFVSHDHKVTFFKIEQDGDKNVTSQILITEGLPFRVAKFLDDNRLIAGGHDNNPCLFVKNGEEWSFKEKIDKEKGEKSSKKVSAFAASKALFQSSTMKGTSLNNDGDSLLKTRHQNQILDIAIVRDSKDEFFSCGLDGKILYWKL